MTSDFSVDMNEYLPLRDVVFNTLRQAILKGELKPGERLLEIALAERLGVSRTPVREAMRKLEQEGLLTLSGGSGRGGRPIRLTETGMKLAEQTVDFVIEAEQRALLDLSSEEQAQLLTLMRRYNDALTFHFSAIDKENTHE